MRHRRIQRRGGDAATEDVMMALLPNGARRRHRVEGAHGPQSPNGARQPDNADDAEKNAFKDDLRVLYKAAVAHWESDDYDQYWQRLRALPMPLNIAEGLELQNSLFEVSVREHPEAHTYANDGVVHMFT